MATDIKRSLNKFLPHLQKAQEDNLNEADTVQRLIKFFEDVLGYDPLSEITREMQIKDKYIDIAIKLDGVIRLLVEAKSAGTVLRDRHIDQAKLYASEGNVRWVLLTNGMAWNLYHLTFDEGIEYEQVFAVDLASTPIDRSAELLALLHHNSIHDNEHEEYWKQRSALSHESIGRALFSADALRFIRREIRRHKGILIDEEDLASEIHSMFSPEVRERIGPVKIHRRRTPRSSKPEQETQTTTAPPPNNTAPKDDLA